MRVLLVLTLAFACWIPEVHADSITQRESFDRIAEIYEAAGMHDLAKQARELGHSLDSANEPAPLYTPPRYQPRAADMEKANRDMRARERQRQQEWEAEHCGHYVCSAK
jgi:hypothetical protein